MTSQFSPQQTDAIDDLRALTKKVSVSIKDEITKSCGKDLLFKILPPISHKPSPIVFVAFGDAGKLKCPYGLSKDYIDNLGVKSDQQDNMRFLVVFTFNYPVNDTLIVNHVNPIDGSQIATMHDIKLSENACEHAWHIYIDPYLVNKKSQPVINTSLPHNYTDIECVTPPSKSSKSSWRAGEWNITLSPEDLSKAIDESQKPSIFSQNNNDEDKFMETSPHEIIIREMQFKIKILEDQVRNLTPNTRSPELRPFDTCHVVMSPFGSQPTSACSSTTGSPEKLVTYVSRKSASSPVSSARNLFSSGAFSSGNLSRTPYIEQKHAHMLLEN